MSEAVVPNHLGVILDGNRRWAKAHKVPLLEGHRQGYLTLKEITKAAFNRGVSVVSAYVFSTENWNRTPKEVKYLMNLALQVMTEEIDELHREGIKIVWVGTAERLSNKLQKAIRAAVELTKNNSRGTLALCFNYGGHQEIIDAANTLQRHGATQKLTEAAFAQALYAPEIPPIDLLIRTSGEQRLSGFMLWRAAYAELYFSDKYWPDFSEADLDAALQDYAGRQRRFGS
ncbi:MAG TPA: polyprenyl diphosphate synthase [Candidatus Saccharimonadales bacterium]|nr:polyprenyl diphosphate synthase [Candidatus Saccharimonadales bacterium]